MDHDVLTTVETDALPLHAQVRRYLEGLIASGDVTRGDRLPTEVDLQEMFSVSRSTVRRALGDLENAGAVARRRGVGTTVEGAIRPDIMKLSSFSEDMADRDLVPSAALLEMEYDFPPDHVAERLGLDVSAAQRLWFLKRLRCADGRPVALHYLYVPPDLAFAPRDLETMDSYYALLQTTFGIEAMTADETLRARICTDDEAEALLCDERAAVLEFERTTYDSGRHPVEYVRGVYRADRYEYELSLYREGRS